MLIDFASLSVLPEQPPEDPLSPHPEHLGRHTRLGGTLPLSRASVASLSLRRQQIPCACPRVHGRGLDDDVALFDELLDMRARVGVGNVGLLGWVKPYFALADASHGGGYAFLGAEVD